MGEYTGESSTDRRREETETCNTVNLMKWLRKRIRARRIRTMRFEKESWEWEEYLDGIRKPSAGISKYKKMINTDAIFIKASAPAPTYFLSALGINTIELQAQAAAMLLPQELNNDTNFKLDNHLQYTSPILITNKPGPEIEVTKADNTEDYRIFAGLNDKTGEIKWLEITCTGKNLTDKKQFFDLEDDCINMENTNKIAFAQYLRIINNSSSAPLNIEKLRLLNAAKLISHKKFKNL